MMTIKEVIQNRVEDLVEYIVSRNKTTKEEAYSYVMQSNTFAMLNDVELELWAEPPGYWTDKIEQEMSGDIESWKNIW